MVLLGVAGHASAQVLADPVIDPDFSAISVTPGTEVMAPTGTGWTFSPSPYSEDANSAPNEAGIANGTGQNMNNAPGGQAAYIQNEASISQAVTLPSSTVTLTFDLEGRTPQMYSFQDSYTNNVETYVTTGQDEIEITLGSVLLYEGTPTNLDNFVSITTPSADFAAGTYQLTIRGVTSGDPSNATVATPETFDDTMTFVDDVTLNVTQTPEPSSTAMLVLGGLVLGGITLRRRFVR